MRDGFGKGKYKGEAVDLNQIWEERRQHVLDMQRRGIVEVSRAQARIQVVCPYSGAFITGAKPLMGRWRRRSGMWSFPEQTWPLLKALIITTFGEENLRLL